MTVAVFRTRLREDADMAALTALGERMYHRAIAMPGFVSYKEFRADDEESLTLVEFASERELLAWRNDAEHRDAQERGRREFFREYQVQVCRVDRAYRFTLDAGRSETLRGSIAASALSPEDTSRTPAPAPSDRLPARR